MIHQKRSVRYILGTNVLPTFIVDVFVKDKQDHSILLNLFH